MKKNEKILLIVGIILVVGIVIISIFITPKEGKEITGSENAEQIIANAMAESEAVKEEEKKDFIEIDVATYMNYYQGSEKKLVLVGRPGCQYCQIAEPILKNIAFEQDLEIYYLNTDNFSEDDQTTFVQSDDYFSGGFGTPLLLSVQNGNILDATEGLTDKAHYEQFFEKNR